MGGGTGDRSLDSDADGRRILIAHLIRDYMTWAHEHYRRGGEETGRARIKWFSLKPFLIDFGSRPCDEVTLDDLEDYQRRLDRSGRYCRRVINLYINDVLAVFRWGVRHRINGRRYVSPGTASDLSFIERLRRGSCQSVDHPRRLSANLEDVERTIPYLPSPVQQIVRLTLLTGARPGEIRILRPCDIKEISPDLWEYRPGHHKTERFGGERVIYLGPKSIAILTAEIAGFDGEPTDFLFRPRDSVRDKWIRRGHPRKKTPSRARRDAQRRAEPKRGYQMAYNGTTLSHSVRRACVKAGVEPWTPYQLRKLAATLIDRDYGVEAAAAVLGHRSTTITEGHYIDPRLKKAAEIARKFG